MHADMPLDYRILRTSQRKKRQLFNLCRILRSYVYRSRMIEFDDMDSRLAHIGKDRAWLAEKTKYSLSYIRDVLAASSTRRAHRVQCALSDAIENEAEQQRLRPTPQMDNHLLIRVAPDEFREWENLALSLGQTVSDYCVAAIQAQYRFDTGKHFSPSKVAEGDSEQANGANIQTGTVNYNNLKPLPKPKDDEKTG